MTYVTNWLTTFLVSSKRGTTINFMRVLIHTCTINKISSYVRLNKMFINSKLTLVNNDPKIFLTKLEKIVVCMNKCAIADKNSKSDTDIILQVITKFPK